MGERAIVLALAYALIAALLTGRLFQLQVINGERYASAVEDSREQTELLPARRGRILDRNGTPIVDNSAGYAASVVLAELELPWRVRRSLPFYLLDEAGFDRLLADLAIRLSRPHDALRTQVLSEMAACPTVAFRRGAEVRDADLSLLAIPAAALAPREDGDARAAELATADLVFADPRTALEREVQRRWQEAAVALTPEELALAASVIDHDPALGGARCLAVLEAFGPLISTTVGIGAGARSLHLHLLTAGRQAQAAAALARFLAVPENVAAERIAHALTSTRTSHAVGALEWGCYFAAGFEALEVVALLPGDAGLYQLELSGVPPARARIILIQGDRPGVADDAFTRFSQRLAATLGAPGEWVAGLIERHSTRTRIQTAERIYRHKLLALDPARIDQLLSGLAERLTAAGLPRSSLELERALAEARRTADRELAGRGPHDPLPLVEDLPPALARRLDGLGTLPPVELRRRYGAPEAVLPGLRVGVVEGRERPFGNTLCHLLGDLGRVEHTLEREHALELGLDPSGEIGRSGLEKLHDDQLRGRIGRRVLRHTGEGVEVLYEKPAQPGSDLVTEIDLEVQQSAEQSLDGWLVLAQQLNVATPKMEAARAVGRGRAGMVVIDCHTGGILALASSPRFTPVDLATRWNELLKDPAEPLYDHAAQAAQPPGSALKILTALAALEDGVMRPAETITTKGYMAMVNGRPMLRSHAPAGTYDLVEAIAISDNCYFATLGQRLGGERLSDYFQAFGVGSINALDVPQQRAGVLPHPSTLGRRWTNSDSWRLAIGQFSTASPLQVVAIAAAVANGGHVVRPFVVRPPGGPLVHDLHVAPEHLDEVRRGMEAVTAPGGTASYLQLGGDLADINVAAKTGTSEWGNTDPTRFPDHSWLIGFAPADEPVIAFAIFIHSGTSGGRACSGVAKAVLEAYFTKYGRAGHAAAR